MQSSGRRQIDVDSQLVTELLQLVHQFGLGWGVAPEQGQLREFSVDVVSCGNVGQQHELLHQPAGQRQRSSELIDNKRRSGHRKESEARHSLVTVSVLVNKATLRHHGLSVQRERQFQLKQNKAGAETGSCFQIIFFLLTAVTECYSVSALAAQDSPNVVFLNDKRRR